MLFIDEVREVPAALMTALQDPVNIPPITDQIKKNVPSHRSPVLCLKWFPSGLELDMKKSFAALIGSSGS
jgi:hypothetical protein